MEFVELGFVLKQYKEIHFINDDELYKQVTISQTGKVSLRGEKRGIKIGRKRQFYINLKKYPHTLVFIRQGVQKGGIGIAPLEVDGCTLTENMPTFSIENCSPDYLKYFLKSPQFKKEVSKLVPTGTAQKAIHEKKLLRITMPLPSIEEQKTIVELLDSNLFKQNNLSQNNKLNSKYIAKLRQAILSEAIQGKLVPQDPNDEPASILLEKIKAKKEKLIKEKKIRKEKPLPEIKEEEIPYELPKGWEWVRFRDILALEWNSMKRGPFGGSLRKDIFVSEGYLVYEQKNAIHNDFKHERYYITKEKYLEMIGFKVRQGDFIISCSGSLGRIAEIPKNAKEGIINQALLKVKVNNELILNNYFLNLFKSDIFQNKLLENSSGSAIINMIGVSEIKKLLIGLPPVNEQKRIVQKVDQLMKLCDELEFQVKENQKNSKSLMNAVLREAFENEA